MVPVPADHPRFCIDKYEGSLAETGVASVPGVLPSVAVTFVEAQARCAATPVVVDGVPHGFKRLARLDEWRDAADGQLGDGGSTYPTGETWPTDRCAILDEQGRPTTQDLVPTGSLPGCVSPFGVHDQLGNAWEWADPQLSVDVEAFVRAEAAAGNHFEVSETGELRLTSGTLSGLAVEVPGLFATVAVDASGVVVGSRVRFEAPEPFPYSGFLVARRRVGPRATGFVLPVQFKRIDGVEQAETAPLRVQLESDGAPLTAKVGCAWYTGPPEGCSTRAWFFGHPADFHGTIGLRCAADPVVPAG
jgi:hypothetical protein